MNYDKLKIAFGYKMGSGKDEACSYLIRKYGGIKLSFAKPIYDILHHAQQICGFSYEKDRQFLQYIGSDWAKKKEKDVWINIALREAKQEKDNVFISDLRFPDEFTALKNDNFVCIKLIRDKQEERKGTGSHQHSSETALDIIPDEMWDYIIDNNSTLDEFHDQLDITIQKVRNYT